MREPFALQLYREFLHGKSITELSAELGISEDRIDRRLRAAALHLGVSAVPHQRGWRTALIRIVRRF